MDSNYVYGIIIGLTAVSGLLLWYLGNDSPKSPDATPLTPTPTPDVRMIDGVAIGYRTYGDLDNELCIHVIDVKNGNVEYTFSNASEFETMPTQQFLETYYRMPNGCKFASNGGIIR